MSDKPPADETDFTAAEIAAAAVHMERILGAEPQLGDFGFGVFDPQSKSSEERAEDLRKNREWIREPDSLAQFLASRAWLRQFAKLENLNRRGTSYGLKHVAEEDIGYVTNGVFIAAAIAESFHVQRVHSSHPNAWFNISSDAWKRTSLAEGTSCLTR
jgi:hypothetical protein